MLLPPFRLSFSVETPMVPRQPRKTRRGARPKCRVPDCESESHTRGMCSTHYVRMWRERERLTVGPSPKCAARGCKNKCWAADVCAEHYAQAFILVLSGKESSWQKALRKATMAKMDTGELRVDYIRRSAEARQKKRARQQKRQTQKYEYLASTVNKNDTAWGEESNFHG